MSGLTADARTLIEHARVESQACYPATLVPFLRVTAVTIVMLLCIKAMFDLCTCSPKSSTRTTDSLTTNP